MSERDRSYDDMKDLLPAIAALSPEVTGCLYLFNHFLGRESTDAACTYCRQLITALDDVLERLL